MELEKLIGKINTLREELKQQEVNIRARLDSREYRLMLDAAETLEKTAIDLEFYEEEFTNLVRGL